MTNYKDTKYQFPASSIISGDISAARMSLAVETKPVVSSVAPSTITNDAQNIVITGTNFVAIPRVDVINTATGIWYSVNTVTRDSATQLTVNLTLAVDAGTYRIRVENPDGNSGISAASFLTVSDAPTWTTGAGSLGSIAGNFSGTVATVAATGDTVTFAETTNVLTNASLANCSLSTAGVITTSDFDGSSTTGRTHTFTIRATDAQSQTTDREFTLTSGYSYSLEWLVIGGGASGGTYYRSGGGGAGGYRNSYASEQSGRLSTGETAWTVTSGDGAITATVGAGGTVPSVNNVGVAGGSSSIAASGQTTVTSYGGGGGGTHQSGSGPAPTGTWGSGGGAGNDDSGASGSSGSAGQGFDGGDCNSTSPSQGAGAGGAGEAGFNNTGTNAMNGGDGMASSITGTSVYRAGGGGGGGYHSSGLSGTGGNGGGGTGGQGSSAPGWYPTSGANASDGYNSGSGGGGLAYNAATSGTLGSGDDGVIFLRMPTASYSGTTSGSPTVLTDSTDTILVFQASGSYTR